MYNICFELHFNVKTFRWRQSARKLWFAGVRLCVFIFIHIKKELFMFSSFKNDEPVRSSNIYLFIYLFIYTST